MQLLVIHTMPKLISKTTFLEFLYCPKNIWLKLHNPALLDKFELSEFEKHLLEQGNEVERYARRLFPDGIEVKSTGEQAKEETFKLMELKTPFIFQATFIADGFISRADVLAYNLENDSWDIYEIKGTNSLKDKEGDKGRNHIDDLSFQTAVLKRSNIKIGSTYLVHLNKEYIRDVELDIESLFVIENVTETIFEKLSDINNQMEASKEYLNRETEPSIGCDCHFNGKSRHCATFEYSHPEIPPYSIHSLIRIGQSKKKLNFLVENKIYHLEDIPEDFELSKDQQNQLRAYKNKKPIIDLQGIQEEISNLQFPLYFFDYEAYAPAIPAFSGYGPYNFIPFQFSLHILKEPNGELEHKEFLHTEMSDPSEKVVKLLDKYIDPKGTVIVWYKTFEKTQINEKIAKRLPEYKAIIDRVNNQIYDLRDVFTKQHYVHPDFKGKTSIKKVLPVLAPEHQYKDLEIHEGGQASEEWWKMVSASKNSKEKENIAKNLKEYCGLDTYAMYAIWKFLMDLSI